MSNERISKFRVFINKNNLSENIIIVKKENIEKIIEIKKIFENLNISFDAKDVK